MMPAVCAEQIAPPGELLLLRPQAACNHQKNKSGRACSLAFSEAFHWSSDNPCQPGLQELSPVSGKMQQQSGRAALLRLGAASLQMATVCLMMQDAKEMYRQCPQSCARGNYCSCLTCSEEEVYCRRMHQDSLGLFMYVIHSLRARPQHSM